MKNLSVIFPIYNEENSIEHTLKEWKEMLDSLSINYEIILAEDGSTDNTKKILFKNIENNKDIFISNIEEKKRGYAEAVLTSLNIARGTYILSVDSDGQCDPRDFEKFWKKRELLSNNSVIIGNRHQRKDTFQRYVMSKSFLLIHKVLFNSKIKDPSCPYIFCKKQTFLNIQENLKFMVEGFWWGFVAVCVKKKINIEQIDINHRKRIDGKTNVFHFSKIPSIAFRNIFGLIKLKLKKI